jgi:hypothetical protein
VEAMLVEALFELRRKTQLQSLYAGILFESALLIFGGKKNALLVIIVGTD